MTRTFTVRSKNREDVYTGFNRDFSPVELEHVVLVTVDGEIDVYAVDDPRNVSSLIQYLTEHEQGETKVLGCYSRKGS